MRSALVFGAMAGLWLVGCALPGYEVGEGQAGETGGIAETGGEPSGEAGDDTGPVAGTDAGEGGIAGTGGGGTSAGGTSPAGGAPDTGGAETGGDVTEGGATVGGSEAGGTASGGVPAGGSSSGGATGGSSSGGTGGASSGGTGGASTGGTDGGSSAGGTDGGSSTGGTDGGSSTGGTGGSSSGGTGGSSSGGTGGTGGAFLVPPHLFTFDSDTEGWELLDPVAAPAAAEATWGDDGTGNGVLVLSVEGLAPDDFARFGIRDRGLAGARSVHFRVQLQSGIGANLITFAQDNQEGFSGGDQILQTLPPGEWVEVSIGLPADPPYDATPSFARFGLLVQAVDATGADPIELLVDDFLVSTAPSTGTGYRPLETCDAVTFCAPAVGSAADTLIDDVDVANAIPDLGGRHGWWYPYDDGTGTWTGGVDTANTLLPSSDANDPGGTAYVVTYTGGSNWGGGLGVTLSNQFDPQDDTVGATCPYDAADYAGVSFWAKGSVPMQFRVRTTQTEPCVDGRFGLCATQCDDAHGVIFDATDTWTRYAFTWDELAPTGWHSPVDLPFDPSSVVGLGWQPADSAGDFTFGVDQVEFLPRDGWSFRSGLEGWTITYAEGTDGTPNPALRTGSSLFHDPNVGVPGAGSLELEIPFSSAPSERVRVELPLAPARDLTGRTLTAQLRVDAWDAIDPAQTPHVELFIKAGPSLCWADGGWVSLAGSPDWIDLRFPLDTPGFVATCTGGAPLTDVRAVGVQIISGDAGTQGPAALHIDSIYLE